MKVAFLLIATNKYVSFLQQFISSADNHAFKGDDVTYCIFTNNQVDLETKNSFKYFSIEAEPWPKPTLKRYDYFIDKKDTLQEYDYLYYSDVDMRFVDDVGSEIFSKMVATTHPGFYNKSNLEFTYDRNPNSMAYVPFGYGKKYYAGGFNGGKSSNFLNMAETISDWRKADEKNNIIPVWHDESYMNKYFIVFPPSLELTPSYCYPESWNIPFTKKLLALDKNHSEMRS